MKAHELSLIWKPIDPVIVGNDYSTLITRITIKMHPT